MNNQEKIQRSKFLSLLLRHKPETIGLHLDASGWANVAELLQKLKIYGQPLLLNELDDLVCTNSKQRFIFSDDHTMIRASQGHSINVELQLQDVPPPDELYHGTAERNIEKILVEGLSKMDRHHVHLTVEMATAKQVGARYGKPIVLRINSHAMQQDGYLFYCSANGVWLTDTVSPAYISLALHYKQNFNP